MHEAACTDSRLTKQYSKSPVESSGAIGESFLPTLVAAMIGDLRRSDGPYGRAENVTALYTGRRRLRRPRGSVAAAASTSSIGVRRRLRHPRGSVVAAASIVQFS